MNLSKFQTLQDGRTPKQQEQLTKSVSLSHFREKTHLFFLVTKVLLSFIGQSSFMLLCIYLYINIFIFI